MHIQQPGSRPVENRPEGRAHQQQGADPHPELERIVHTNMRKTIARRLSESKRTIPHFYLTMDCDVGALARLRTGMREADPTVRAPTVNDFVVCAAARALRRAPALNAWWSEDAIIRHREANVCLAIGTERGLFAPVLRQADSLAVGDLSTAARTLVERTKAGRLTAADYEGGTFTVSNLGMYGIREFSAIINPPQVGILAVGAVGTRVQVDAQGWRPVEALTLTLSADHRAVDGTAAARFLNEIRAMLERPESLVAAPAFR